LQDGDTNTVDAQLCLALMLFHSISPLKSAILYNPCGLDVKEPAMIMVMAISHHGHAMIGLDGDNEIGVAITRNQNGAPVAIMESREWFHHSHTLVMFWSGSWHHRFELNENPDTNESAARHQHIHGDGSTIGRLRNRTNWGKLDIADNNLRLVWYGRGGFCW
jgi:hypothetical protein